MPFLPGLELSRRLYEEVIRPLLERYFPDLPYAAARIGPGSDVIGFDTEMSMDHDWGPQLQLFLQEQDAPLVPELDELFSTHLPSTFAGFPVNFADESERTSMHPTEKGPINHRVLCLTLREFVQARLAYDLDHPLEVADWLSIPSQKLLEMTAGAVYHDGIGTLTELRTRLGWYPRDVWLMCSHPAGSVLRKRSLCCLEQALSGTNWVQPSLDHASYATSWRCAFCWNDAMLTLCSLSQVVWLGIQTSAVHWKTLACPLAYATRNHLAGARNGTR